ncbi:hypothetical protein PENTCL1PPCAC_9350 [Pristionchus entomophagus]|uniref:Uncharacterized protein n=1 Tax=Pristionchus entomophagus TaxID=358040 RepID=A0AAV5SWS4_9BILA|nr:hypothetical protein PENTCL1PPCAC_9350 [Pristionchus entomophagus]
MHSGTSVDLALERVLGALLAEIDRSSVSAHSSARVSLHLLVVRFVSARNLLRSVLSMVDWSSSHGGGNEQIRVSELVLQTTEVVVATSSSSLSVVPVCIRARLAHGPILRAGVSVSWEGWWVLDEGTASSPRRATVLVSSVEHVTSGVALVHSRATASILAVERLTNLPVWNSLELSSTERVGQRSVASVCQPSLMEPIVSSPRALVAPLALRRRMISDRIVVTRHRIAAVTSSLMSATLAPLMSRSSLPSLLPLHSSLDLLRTLVLLEALYRLRNARLGRHAAVAALVVAMDGDLLAGAHHVLSRFEFASLHD